MWKQRWLLALPLVLAVTAGSAGASTIRDRAGLFDPDAVRQAEAKLEQVERETGVPTTIETIESLEGQPLDVVAKDRARRDAGKGIFVLIPKQEHKIDVLVSPTYASAFPRERRMAIQDAFIAQFKQGNFDAGLNDGVQTITREIETAKAERDARHGRAGAPAVAPFPGRRAVPARGGNGFGLGSLLGIGLIIVAVLVGIRLIGSLFGGRGGYGAQPGPGMMGRPGYGPGGGYGGGGGGGFMSSLFGGIGGAMAGNWLYDQFSGRHHQGGSYSDNTGYAPGGDAPAGDAGNDWVGGGSEAGDWGGGGGDVGGGGGDWGGGGGGDWGGGGGDGGSW